MPRPPFALTLAAAAVAAGAALPAAASAATVTLPGACYVQIPTGTQPIPVSVAGLSPAQSVTLKLSRKGTPAGSAFGTADAAGNLALPLTSWYLSLGSGPSKEVAAQVDAVDALGAVVASAPVSIANLAVSVTGTSKLRNWKVQGLTALTGKKKYYAHYFNNGKYKGRLSLGKAKGNCGYLKTKKPLTPFSKLGRYDVVVQAGKKYDEAAPGIKGRVVVTRRYR